MNKIKEDFNNYVDNLEEILKNGGDIAINMALLKNKVELMIDKIQFEKLEMA